jgi:hypothetical protein
MLGFSLPDWLSSAGASYSTYLMQIADIRESVLLKPGAD